MLTFWCFVSGLGNERKRSSPGGGDMRSAHAGACFVRVGPRRFGSVLESFWEPSAPLYSFLVARVTKTGSQREGKKQRKNREERPHFFVFTFWA